MRRTKIIATLGPATDPPGMLEKLFSAGTDVFRLNYSHQTHHHHEERLSRLRELSKTHRRAVGIIADLQGPKIRLEHFGGGRVELREGSTFTIDTELPPDAGNETHVGVSYKDLPRDVRAGDTLLVDDGRIVLRVQEVHGHEVACEVISGGELTDSKGLNLQGGGLSAGALTEKDKRDLAHAVRIGRRALGIARQSVLAGIGLSLVAMAFAAAGYIAPVAGALLQEVIDVGVILNALRGLRE